MFDVQNPKVQGAQGTQTDYPLGVEEGTIVLENVKGLDVSVYDDYGRQVEHLLDCPATFRYTPTAPGNYLLRITGNDNAPSQSVTLRVVVQ